MSEIRRGRQHENDPIEPGGAPGDLRPLGWNIYAGSSYAGFVPRLGDERSPASDALWAVLWPEDSGTTAAGHMLHSILNPEPQPGPPWLHTFTLPEEIGQPPRTGHLRRLWRQRCRWHLLRHQRTTVITSARLLSYSTSGPGFDRVRTRAECANCKRAM